MHGVSLIPFVVGLIGYDQCAKDAPDLWKHGPEYNFRFNVLASIDMASTEPDHIASSNVSAIIKCRPFASKSDEMNDAMRCHVSSAEIDNYETDKSTTPPNITRPELPGPFEITGYTFDIIYGQAHIKEIRIHNLIQNDRMNMYRDIISQLNLAFSGFSKEEARFAARNYESSTVGDCDTKFEVFQRMKFTGKAWESPCKKMHLKISGTNYPSIMLEKTRNMKNCTKRSSYFFGGVDNSSNPPFLVPHTNTSVSGFLIAPQSFESHTIRMGIMTVTKKSGETKKFEVNEEIGLRLMSIEPASAKFESLGTYGVTKIFADDRVTVLNDKVYTVAL